MYLRATQPIIVNHPPIMILPSAGTTKQHIELLAFGLNPSSCVASALSCAMLLRATPPTAVNTPHLTKFYHRAGSSRSSLHRGQSRKRKLPIPCPNAIEKVSFSRHSTGTIHTALSIERQTEASYLVRPAQTISMAAIRAPSDHETTGDQCHRWQDGGGFWNCRCCKGSKATEIRNFQQSCIGQVTTWYEHALSLL